MLNDTTGDAAEKSRKPHGTNNQMQCGDLVWIIILNKPTLQVLF
jgi:hypothetical protein